MAMNTYGTTFKYGATSADKELAIKSYPQILAKRSSLDVTTLQDDAKVYIPSIRETPDSLDFTLNWDAAVFAEINNLNAAQKCELTFSLDLRSSSITDKRHSYIPSPSQFTQ